MDQLVIGLDIGATWLRAALADEDGKIILRASERTGRSEEELKAQLKRLVRELSARAGSTRIVAVGVGSIGPLDIREGAILNTPNLPVKRVEVVKAIEEELGVPVYMLNDCTAACYGEWLLGAGRGLLNLVYVAFGTGIGGGAVVDGHLLLGEGGNAVEIGHLVVDARGRLKCGCGGRGHWEAYCSGSGIPRFLRAWVAEAGLKPAEVEEELGVSLSQVRTEVVFEAARRGSGVALAFLDEVARLNAAGLASMINAFSPSLITVGGSVALNNFDLFIEKALRYLSDYAFNPVPRIIPSSLGPDATLKGAIALALRPPEELLRLRGEG